MVVEKLVTFLNDDGLSVVSKEEKEVHELQKMRAVFGSEQLVWCSWFEGLG